MAFPLIMPLIQMAYGGFNPYGTSKQPAIALGRSIAHAFGSGTGPQPGNAPQDQYNTGAYGPGLSPSDIAQYAPAPYQPQPFIEPGPNHVPPPPGHFAVPQGPVTMPYGSGPSYGGTDPFGRFNPNLIHSLANPENMFFAGLQAWNRGQANPTGGETAAWQESGLPMPGWMAHKQALLAASGLGKDRGAAGIMPVRNQ